MKTIFIGDIHGCTIWKDIVIKENADRVIFIGDYFDSFYIPGIDQIHNFKEIVEYKKTSGKEVILLVGNHDFHYMNVSEAYSGFQLDLKFDIEMVLKENMKHLQMAYSFDKFLCTHAGVSPVFMDRWFKNTWNCDNLVEKLNETFTYNPFIFRFNRWDLKSLDLCGDDVIQSPIWIHIKSLLLSNKKRRKDSIKDRFIQIVGHTQIKSIDIKATDKSMGSKYYMIDALPSKQYLIYDGELKVGTINE
jgi:hypothetical protein